MISRWHALVAFRFPDIQRLAKTFWPNLFLFQSLSLWFYFNIQTNNEISAFKNWRLFSCEIKLLVCDSQTNSAKKISVKIGVSTNKNDLIVISISFLAFNFRGIIQRTSGKHSPLLFSFLNYAKIRSAGWMQWKETWSVEGERKGFRTRLTTRIISFYLAGRSVASFIGGCLFSIPYLYFVTLSLFSIIFSSFDHSNFPFLQNNGFYESIKENNIKYTVALK